MMGSHKREQSDDDVKFINSTASVFYNEDQVQDHWYKDNAKTGMH